MRRIEVRCAYDSTVVITLTVGDFIKKKHKTLTPGQHIIIFCKLKRSIVDYVTQVWL